MISHLVYINIVSITEILILRKINKSHIVLGIILKDIIIIISYHKRGEIKI